MYQKKLFILWSVIWCAILHISRLNGSTRSSATHSCAGYNQECDSSKPIPCCDTKLKCKPTNSRIQKVCLEPAVIGLFCYNDGDCDDIRHAKCSLTQQCECRSNNFRVNETYCAPLLGAFCWNNEKCANNNATCVNSICQCKDNYSCSSNDQKSPVEPQTKIEIGSTCEDDRECAEIKFAVCSIDKKCSCPISTFPIDSQTCRPNIHNSCVDDLDCLVKKSSCIENRCLCDPEFIYLNGECQAPYVGMPCIYDSHCHQLISFTKCSTENKCTCIDNYYLMDNICVFGFTALCSQTKPCSNLNFDCIDNMCQCKANYTFWNGQCLSIDLGKFCSTNADCDAIEFAKCSDIHKCVCRSNYEENNGKCIPLLGGHCLTNGDCIQLNSLCIDSRCWCDANFSKILNNKCLPTKLGFSCEKDEDCLLIPHAKCSFWQCVCQKGYMRQNAKCAPLLGTSCLSNEVCVVPNSVCIDNFCQCDVNYVEQSNEYCMLVTLRKACNNYTICPDFSKCSAKNLCKCESNYGAKSDSACAPLLNQSCSTFCLADHSICLDGICQCEMNYVAHSSAICKLDYFKTYLCWENSDCSLVNNAVCDDTQKCFCDKNYTKLNGLSCAPLLGGNCAESKDCFVKNSICHLNTCICKQKYFAISNYKCESHSLGANCQSNRDCRSIWNSECSSSNICICKSKHIAINEFSCKPILGGYCTRDHDCDYHTMECIANKCQCKPKYTEMSANICIETIKVFSCKEPSECSDSWHFTCSPNGYCVCQPNNTAINHATCLPTLRGLCWKDDQCTARKSICVDYRCACKEGYVPVSNNFCATAD